jgi:hypothetical protein
MITGLSEFVDAGPPHERRHDPRREETTTRG